MPDTRSHRGAHPEDALLFDPAHLPVLRHATDDLCWLLDRGYAMRSALVLVGDQYSLAQRQRLAVSRCAASATSRAYRTAHEIAVDRLPGNALCIDGYNVLITVEAALGGGVLLHGRDGCWRDLASLHGTYRTVAETRPAAELIGDALARFGITHAQWLLDRPVSNSGRLKELLLELAAARGWSWDVQLEFSPDAVLARSHDVVATSDSAVLDRCERWTNLAKALIPAATPGAFTVDLS